MCQPPPLPVSTGAAVSCLPMWERDFPASPAHVAGFRLNIYKKKKNIVILRSEKPWLAFIAGFVEEWLCQIYLVQVAGAKLNPLQCLITSLGGGRGGGDSFALFLSFNIFHFFLSFFLSFKLELCYSFTNGRLPSCYKCKYACLCTWMEFAQPVICSATRSWGKVEGTSVQWRKKVCD